MQKEKCSADELAEKVRRILNQLNATRDVKVVTIVRASDLGSSANWQPVFDPQPTPTIEWYAALNGQVAELQSRYDLE